MGHVRANAGNVNKSFRSANREWSSGKKDYGRRNNVHVCTCIICERKYWGKKMRGAKKLCKECAIDLDQPDSVLAFKPYRYLNKDDLKKIVDKYEKQGVKITYASDVL